MNIKKPTFLLLLSLLISCFSFSQTKEEKTLQLSPYVGINLPQDELKDFSKNGAVFGISIDKYLSKNFALGIDFNYQYNDFSNPFDFSSISVPYSILNTTNGKWNASAITFGPTYRLGTSKFNVDIYAKFGLLYLKTPQTASVFQYPNGIKTIFDLPEQKRSGFGITSGIRLNYQISKKISLFLNLQYVYGSAKVEYCNCGLDNLDNPELIIDQDPIKESFSPSYFNVNAGLTFSFGEVKNIPVKNPNETLDPQEESICDDTKLKSPYNGQTYFADSGVVPEFNWINHSKPKATSYSFELFYGEKRLFEKTVKQPNFKFTKKMTSDFYNLDGKREYSWRITTNYNNCEPTTTDISVFTIKPTQNSSTRSGPSDCIYNFTNIDIQCDSPAYDDSGNVKYTGTFTVQNTSSVPGVLTPHVLAGNNQIFDVVNTSGILTITNTAMPSSCPPVPMSTVSGYPGYSAALQPNQSASFCFELSLPISSSSVTFVAGMVTRPGTNDQSICGPSQTIELPNCICDICEDWDIVPSNKRFWVFPFPVVSNMRIRQDIQILNADPIMKVDAEIISVQHAVSDEQCYTCTKDHSKMGVFASGSQSGKISSNNGWQNNGIAELKDDNSDGYGNQFTWKSLLATGVDFSNTKTFEMNISLPDLSKLECCHSKYKVCIRYTFTDINCQTCSELTVCYDYDSSLDNTGNGGIGSGGIGTGVGNQQNQSGILLKPSKSFTTTNKIKNENIKNKKLKEEELSDRRQGLESSDNLIKSQVDQVESIEQDLQNDGGIEHTASRSSRCNSRVGIGVFNYECGKIKIDVSSASNNNSEYRVRYYWKKKGTSTWWRQTYFNVNSRIDYLAYLQPGYTYDLRIVTRARSTCIWKERFSNEVLVKSCNQIQFTINDDSKSYCLPLNMTTQTNFGVNYSFTEFKLCEVNQQGIINGNCVTESWNSYDSNVITRQLNLKNWALSKGMNLRQNRYYSFEILADSKSYKNYKQVFYIKSWRDCPIVLNQDKFKQKSGDIQPNSN
ncbi:outer membrane beta-barrel protein [Aequorivita todarodis]|uniref:outer membrane beta-barrel protein n=1 Tax=Aequorivita todarodis TaxID=2036821 RepID=UPI00234FC5D2|nr:outer membrane beta-barrel protein [Aequorivita todarodis]MDC8001463.1 outer membrane beta-barrel protein [Aequorivita todarodis]